MAKRYQFIEVFRDLLRWSERSEVIEEFDGLDEAIEFLRKEARERMRCE